MKAFRVSFRIGNGDLEFGVYVIAPTIERAIELTPGQVKSIDEAGPCIAVDQVREVNPIRKFLRG